MTKRRRLKQEAAWLAAIEAAAAAADQYELDIAVACTEAVACERERMRELDGLAADLGPAFAADFQQARYDAPSTAGEVAMALFKSGRWRPDVVVDELAARRGQPKPGPKW